MSFDPAILQNFQFAAPLWLWGLLLLPAILVLYALFYRQRNSAADLSRFADPHLLPHLMADNEAKGKRRKNRLWLSLLLWSLLWTLGLLAMAGPRWDYTEVKAFAPARNLVILLDLSRSMDTQDIRPSRLARARQEIADLGRMAEGVNLALIAFASVPHVITPLTDDYETLRRLLPSLETGLVHIQGSNLAPALQRAGAMFEDVAEMENHILILSDGGFQDGDAAIFRAQQELIAQGVRIHVMGMGTAQGAPLPDGEGGYIRQGGTVVMAQLEEDRLRRIARDGRGLYLDASYLEGDTTTLLSQINRAAESTAQKTARFWEERFYLFLAPVILLLLPWFRRGAAFPVLVLLLCQPVPAQAFEWRDLFLNREQQGKAAIEQQRYKEAAETFADPYRRGVAHYKAGDYEQAAQSFMAADRPEIADEAQYNLGNAQLMSGKIEDAIKSYEKVLKDNPAHKDAAHNLAIAKKLLQQQQQQQQQQNNGQSQNQGQQQQGQQGQQDRQQTGDKSGESGAQDKDENKQAGAEQKETPSGERQDEQTQENPGEQARNESRESDDKNNQDLNQTPQQAQRTQQDINADRWLSRIESNPEQFLRNKFFIESKRQGAQQGETPW